LGDGLGLLELDSEISTDPWELRVSSDVFRGILTSKAVGSLEIYLEILKTEAL